MVVKDHPLLLAPVVHSHFHYYQTHIRGIFSYAVLTERLAFSVKGLHRWEQFEKPRLGALFHDPSTGG